MMRIRSKFILPALFIPIILFGQSLPRFQEWPIHIDGRFSSPALADVNRDGFPDLFIPQCPETDGDQNRISIFLNREETG
jgi:hypothetical protein